jgi:pimeloyl-ACP methyl ester carboxylesterase
VRRTAALVCATAVAATASVGALAEAYPPADQHLPPMVLDSEGIFWAGGQVVNRTQPGSENNKQYVGKAYVEYFIPHKRRFRTGADASQTVPIVMTHSSLSGANWRTTPDGREGWAQWFVRRGFPVYVIDPPGKGRAGFDPDQVNQAATGLIPTYTNPPLTGVFDSSAWNIWNAGPEFGVLGDGILYGNTMPIDEGSLRHWLAFAGLPSGPSPSPGGPDSAFIAVLEKIKAHWGQPPIFIGWSAGATLAQRLVGVRPDLFKAIVDLENGRPGCTAAGTREGPPPPAFVAAIVAWGGPYVHVNSGAGQIFFRGFARTYCHELIDAVVAAGGDATLLWMGDFGILGDSHMMMWGAHSDEIAQVVLNWIEKHVEKRKETPSLDDVGTEKQ